MTGGFAHPSATAAEVSAAYPLSSRCPVHRFFGLSPSLAPGWVPHVRGLSRTWVEHDLFRCFHLQSTPDYRRRKRSSFLRISCGVCGPTALFRFFFDRACDSSSRYGRNDKLRHRRRSEDNRASRPAETADNSMHGAAKDDRPLRQAPNPALPPSSVMATTLRAGEA